LLPFTEEDDTAPAFFHHVGHDLFGHVEHGVQVGVDHCIPVFACHFQEHAILGDACVVHQHINDAMFFFRFGESGDGGIPITHVTHRGVERVAQGFLLVQPFGEVTRWAAARNDLETLFVKALANRGTNTAHATCDVRYFLTHVCLHFYEWLR
jgi:hypothetical protein